MQTTFSKILFTFLITLNSLWAFASDSSFHLEKITIDSQREASNLWGGSSNSQQSVLSLDIFDLQGGQSEIKNIERQSAAVTMNYSALGYWDAVSVRGFGLDPRNNYWREELPYIGETKTLLSNKSSVELLKGSSGVFAGASAPGGLLHYRVKRPLPYSFKQLTTASNQYGEFKLGGDINYLFKEGSRHRINLYGGSLKSGVQNSQGEESLLAWAGEWSAGDGLLEMELEWSYTQRPSQAGVSLVAGKVPQIKNINYNINSQSWSEPVRFENLVYTLKWSQNLGSNWRGVLIGGGQQVLTDDYMAYPFGCSSENNYESFCSDGSFDLYDFRSLGEKRENYSFKGYLQHEANNFKTQMGVLFSQEKARFNNQTYQYVGVGRLYENIPLSSNAATNDVNTDRDLQRLEAFVNSEIKYGDFIVFTGFRIQQLNKESVRTDGSRETKTEESNLLPFISLSHNGFWQSYISYSGGVESVVVPNKSSYDQKGEALPDARNSQVEIGFSDLDKENWRIQLFEVRRAYILDAAPFYGVNGEITHRGVEADLEYVLSEPLEIHAKAMILESQKKHVTRSPVDNGKAGVNVPKYVLRVKGQYRLEDHNLVAIEYLSEGQRAVVKDNKLDLPEWNIWNLEWKYGFAKDTYIVTRLDNILNENKFKESPQQYGHVYLYPLEERRLSLSLVSSF